MEHKCGYHERWYIWNPTGSYCYTHNEWRVYCETLHERPSQDKASRRILHLHSHTSTWTYISQATPSPCDTAPIPRTLPPIPLRDPTPIWQSAFSSTGLEHHSPDSTSSRKPNKGLLDSRGVVSRRRRLRHNDRRGRGAGGSSRGRGWRDGQGGG